MLILNSLLPVFIIILIGYLLRRRNFITHDIQGGLNKLAYWVALPAFLFFKIAASPISAGAAQTGFWVLLGSTLASLGVMYALGYARRVPDHSLGTLLQGSFRGNLAFIGLPVILFSNAALGSGARAELETTVVLSLTGIVIVYNVLGVGVLIFHNPDADRRGAKRRALRSMVSNPLLLACAVGLVFNGWQLPLPTVLGRVGDVLAPAAFPMALLGIGSQLAETPVRGQALRASPAVCIKLVICPLTAWGLGLLLGMAGPELKAMILLSGTPTAVSSYVLVDQLKGDSPLAAAVVVISTALSLLTLSVWLALPM